MEKSKKHKSDKSADMGNLADDCLNFLERAILLCRDPSGKLRYCIKRLSALEVTLKEGAGPVKKTDVRKTASREGAFPRPKRSGAV